MSPADPPSPPPFPPTIPVSQEVMTSFHDVKISTLTRNNLIWDSHKNEIRRLYIEKDLTLKETIKQIEETRDFHSSERKWKMKLKEWNFDKNLSAIEADFMAKKAIARMREQRKATAFFRHGLPVPSERLAASIKRMASRGENLTTQQAATPPTILYSTPYAFDSDELLPEGCLEPPPNNSSFVKLAQDQVTRSALKDLFEWCYTQHTDLSADGLNHLMPVIRERSELDADIRLLLDGDFRIISSNLQASLCLLPSKTCVECLHFIWNGLLGSPETASPNALFFCEKLVASFPRCGLWMVQWRCRLEFVKYLTINGLDMEANKQHMLAFLEYLSLSKAGYGGSHSETWNQIASVRECHPALALRIIEEVLRVLEGIGMLSVAPDILAAFKNQFEKLEYESSAEEGVELYLRLFNSCFKKRMVIKDHKGIYEDNCCLQMLSEASWSICQAFDITTTFLLNEESSPIVQPELKAWQKVWIKLPHLPDRCGISPEAISKVAVIKELIQPKGQRDAEGNVLTAIFRDEETSLEIAKDECYSSDPMDIDEAASAYGITYTESLSSCPSMNYSALFPRGR